MRNFILGFLVSAALFTGISISANLAGPVISGESGTLDYRVVIDGDVVCSDPWLSIPEKVIECDEPFVQTPKTPKKLSVGVVTE